MSACSLWSGKLCSQRFYQLLRIPGDEILVSFVRWRIDKAFQEDSHQRWKYEIVISKPFVFHCTPFLVFLSTAHGPMRWGYHPVSKGQSYHVPLWLVMLQWGWIPSGIQNRPTSPSVVMWMKPGLKTRFTEGQEARWGINHSPQYWNRKSGPVFVTRSDANRGRIRSEGQRRNDEPERQGGGSANEFFLCVSA